MILLPTGARSLLSQFECTFLITFDHLAIQIKHSMPRSSLETRWFPVHASGNLSRMCGLMSKLVIHAATMVAHF